MHACRPKTVYNIIKVYHWTFNLSQISSKLLKFFERRNTYYKKGLEGFLINFKINQLWKKLSGGGENPAIVARLFKIAMN